MQTCILACAAVIQGVGNCFMGWSIHGRILFWRTCKIQKKQGHHSNQRAKYSHKQTCYLPGVSPLGFEPRFSFWPFYLGLALKKLVPGEGRSSWWLVPILSSSAFVLRCVQVTSFSGFSGSDTCILSASKVASGLTCFFMVVTENLLYTCRVVLKLKLQELITHRFTSN